MCDVTVNALLGNWYISRLAHLGAIYGVLLAFGVLYPESIILFMFIFQANIFR